jgi:hypothetical protein
LAEGDTGSDGLVLDGRRKRRERRGKGRIKIRIKIMI